MVLIKSLAGATKPLESGSRAQLSERKDETLHAAYLKRTNARGASACRDGRICVCACGRVSRRRRALTRAESNNSREYVRPRYESLDTSVLSLTRDSRSCMRAYARVQPREIR